MLHMFVAMAEEIAGVREDSRFRVRDDSRQLPGNRAGAPGGCVARALPRGDTVELEQGEPEQGGDLPAESAECKSGAEVERFQHLVSDCGKGIGRLRELSLMKKDLLDTAASLGLGLDDSPDERGLGLLLRKLDLEEEVESLRARVQHLEQSLDEGRGVARVSPAPP